MPMLSLSTRCNPIRISLMGKDIIMLTLTVKNISEEPRLVSVDMEVPPELSLDETGILNKKSTRLGELMPGVSGEVRFDIRATHRASPKEYSARMTAFVNYRNYNSVLEKVSTTAAIRVIE